MEFVIPTVVDLSDYRGDGGCFHPISCRVFPSGTICFAVKNSAVISASAADNTTYFMICTMASSGSFHLGMLSLSDRKMWAQAMLLEDDSLLKPVSTWEAHTILLAW